MPAHRLVGEGSLDPEAFRHFAGRTHVFRVADHHPWPWLRRIGLDRHLLRAWGSVLTTAFDLALQMGCDPIVFTGADLAFTDGRPYARGTTFEEEWRRARALGDTLESSWAQRVAAWPIRSRPTCTAAACAPRRISSLSATWIVTEAGRVPARTIVNATGAGILAGGSIRQASVAEALAGCRALAEPAADTLARRHPSGGPPVTTIPGVPDDVRTSWRTFAGVSDASIDDALRTTPTAGASAASVLAEPGPAGHTDDKDERYLVELSRAASVHRHVLASADQDLLAELRELTPALGPNDAIAVQDHSGVSAGAQVRQAVDVLLCEQPDLWVDYRRFADVTSRLTVLRRGALGRTPPVHDADAAKWDAAHAPVAGRSCRCWLARSPRRA